MTKPKPSDLEKAREVLANHDEAMKMGIVSGKRTRDGFAVTLIAQGISEARREERKRLVEEAKEHLEEYFPKGKCKERGKAIMIIAKLAIEELE